MLTRCYFNLVESIIIFAVLAYILLFFIAPMLPSRGHEKARRVNCAGNLKQIGLAIQMYAGDFDQYFPNRYPNGGNSFEPMADQHYLENGRVWTCPSREDVLTTAANSGFIYIGSGLKNNDPQARTTSLAHDRPENHPEKWVNVLFIDRHVEGGRPGEKPFLPAK